MKGYTSETIRNVALVGHGGCGKTTFLESALLATGVIDRLGKVEDGNTVSDYDKMEIEKGFSINTSIVPVEWKDSKINFISTESFGSCSDPGGCRCWNPGGDRTGMEGLRAL